MERLNNWARSSVMLKLLVIGFLMLVLLIPSNMITSLIYERENLRDEAIREVSGKWGDNQTITGPVISVPYNSVKVSLDGKTKTSSNGYVHFLPDELDIDGNIAPSKRYRGIYVVVLYNTRLKITGKFNRLNVDALNVPADDLQWDKAIFTLGISDMKGIEKSLNLQLGTEQYQLGPGTITNDIFESGANSPIAIGAESENINFSFDLNLNGSTDLYFVPFGKETKVNINSTWANPKFEGAFLPDERLVEETGFSAQWSVLQLNRNYPQQGVGKYMGTERNQSYFRENVNAFGVKLLLPIDEYQKTNRSAKYATFFIFITFLTFFFIEVLNKKRLHPIQYLLVGAAIILFYILLLSLSEHFSFNWSYLISCSIILALITTYCHFILKNTKLTTLVFGVLGILYGFFYSLLQLQDYALLLGSIGLLLILATIMYLTRNIDWYDMKK